MPEAVVDIAGQHPNEVFERYRPLLFSIAYSILGIAAVAQDKVQETLVQWTRLSAPPITNARAFLVTTVASLSVDYLQHGRSSCGSRAPEHVSGGPPPCKLSDSSIIGSISAICLVMLSRLTPIERIVFLLRTVFNCDYAQIAQTIGQDEEQCRRTMQRIKRAMKRNRSALASFPALDVSQI